jgi:flavorubredoxin
MTEVAKSGLIALGAPTMNNQMFPAMADVITYLKGLKPANKIGFAFGAFGWSGEGAKQISAAIDEMNWQQPVAPVQAKYMPDEAVMLQIRDAGASLAEALLANIAAAE